jgi:hypothetical protein
MALFCCSVCQCHLQFEKARRPSSLCLNYFSLTKNLNHITKDASIFHLELGSSCKPNYLGKSRLHYPYFLCHKAKNLVYLIIAMRLNFN